MDSQRVLKRDAGGVRRRRRPTAERSDAEGIRRRRRPTAERSDSKSLYLAIDASSGANSFEIGFLALSAFQFAIGC